MKLLVGTAETPYHASSLDIIARLAASDEVTLLHVSEKGSDAGKAESVARETQAGLATRGVRATTRSLGPGDAGDALVREGRALGAELIVMRAHDRHPGIFRTVFGDTVTRVIERADRPVLALRAQAPIEGKSVLLASGRPGSRVMDATARVALTTSSPVTVLHVVPSDKGEDTLTPMLGGPAAATSTPPDAADREAFVATALEALRQRGARAEPRYREGIVEEQIALEANSGEHWLLVVRGRTTGMLFRVLWGHSFTEDIVRHVRTSILVVK